MTAASDQEAKVDERRLPMSILEIIGDPNSADVAREQWGMLGEQRILDAELFCVNLLVCPLGPLA